MKKGSIDGMDVAIGLAKKFTSYEKAGNEIISLAFAVVTSPLR